MIQNLRRLAGVLLCAARLGLNIIWEIKLEVFGPCIVSLVIVLSDMPHMLLFIIVILVVVKNWGSQLNVLTHY